jgi:hypothetical protein
VPLHVGRVVIDLPENGRYAVPINEISRTHSAVSARGKSAKQTVRVLTIMLALPYLAQLSAKSHKGNTFAARRHALPAFGLSHYGSRPAHTVKDACRRGTPSPSSALAHAGGKSRPLTGAAVTRAADEAPKQGQNRIGASS